LLFVLGGAAGLLLARVMASVLASRLPMLPFPVDLALTLDGRVIAYTVGLSLAAALLSGLTPALAASKTDILSSLRNDSGLVGRLRLRHAFVVSQVALSLVLVISAGLFMRALQRAASIDPGFDAHAVELASVDLAQAGYTNTTGPLFIRELIDRVRALPGVQSASMAAGVPGGFEVRREALAVPGLQTSDGRFVGVAGDIQSSSLVDGFARAAVYVPLQQQYVSNVRIIARTTRGHRIADQFRGLLGSMTPNVPIMTEQTLEGSVALGLAPQRIVASVAGGLGVVGLLLVAIGIYGVTAYAVARRTR